MTHRAPGTLRLVLAHLAADARLNRQGFEAAVLWFGPDLQRAGAFLMFFVGVPVLSVYMSGGAPAFYTGVLYFALMSRYADVLADRGGFPSAVRLHGPLAGGVGIAALALTAYAASSVAWSVDSSRAAVDAIKLAAGILVMLGILWLMPERRRGWQLALPALGLGAAALLLVVEFSPLPLVRESLYGENAAYMNRAVVVEAFLLWPFLAAAGGSLVAAQRVGLGVLVAVAVFTSDSQAAMLGLVAGTFAALLATVAPRLLGWLLAGWIVASFTAAPFLTPHLGRLLHVAGFSPFLDTSNLRRIEIWNSFIEAAWQRPWLGWGLRSSAEFGLIPISNVRWLTGAAYHPHSMLIQTWTELGAVGVALVVALLLVVVRRVVRIAPARRPFAFGCLAGGLAIGSVSHGMWQIWWVCLILGAVITFVMLEREARPGTGPDGAG